MVDHLTPKARSANMRAIKGKDTKPEMRVRRAAHALGLRFRLHRKDLPGSPDLTFAKHRTVIFVHGCFWHRHPGCRKTTVPKTDMEFWSAKFARNVERDASYEAKLRAKNWRVVIVWECQTINKDELFKLIANEFNISV